jgi:hypothetical protein
MTLTGQQLLLHITAEAFWDSCFCSKPDPVQQQQQQQPLCMVPVAGAAVRGGARGGGGASQVIKAAAAKYEEVVERISGRLGQEYGIDRSAVAGPSAVRISRHGVPYTEESKTCPAISASFCFLLPLVCPSRQLLESVDLAAAQKQERLESPLAPNFCIKITRHLFQGSANSCCCNVLSQRLTPDLLFPHRCLFVCISRQLLESVDHAAAQKQERLESELHSHKTNLIKESIRLGHNDLGDFFYNRGDLQVRGC